MADEIDNDEDDDDFNDQHRRDESLDLRARKWPPRPREVRQLVPAFRALTDAF